MHEIYLANSRVEKILDKYLSMRRDIKNKFERLKQNPRTEIGAHPLHGILSGKWGCWLGSNIRMVYSIDDSKKTIYVESIGTHKIY